MHRSSPHTSPHHQARPARVRSARPEDGAQITSVAQLSIVGLALLASSLLTLSCSGPTRLELVGTVERKTLEMATPVSEVIVAIPVRLGQRVSAGDVLVRMDAEVARAELEASQAAVAAASATLIAAEQEFGRFEDLRRANVAAARQLDEARRARDEALAAVAERKARLTQARKHLADLNIRTWADGFVDQLPFDVGERVPGGGVVAVVLAAESPYVRVWLPARVVSRAARGAPAEISIEGLDEPLTGHLEEVASEPAFTPHYALTERESATLVYESRIVIDNPPEGLRPGLPASLELRLAAHASDTPAPDQLPGSEPEAQEPDGSGDGQSP